MPATTTCQELLLETLPEAIETEEQYDSAAVRLSKLVRKPRPARRDETRLRKVPAALVRDYDERNGLPPAGMIAAEALRYLVQHSGMAAVALGVGRRRTTHLARPHVEDFRRPRPAGAIRQFAAGGAGMMNWRRVVDTFRTLAATGVSGLQQFPKSRHGQPGVSENALE